MKKQIIRAVATTMLALGLSTGVAAAQSGSISNTGADSNNTVNAGVTNKADVKDQNELGVSSGNWQNSRTGDAKTKDNTTGGDATSGDASNMNTVSAAVTVDNTGVTSTLGDMTTGDPSGTINTTGYESSNTVNASVSNDLRVTNTNDVTVTSENGQSASTGSASVEYNTTGGSATSGSASNTSSSDTTIDVSN
jgi:hypothetical protein